MDLHFHGVNVTKKIIFIQRSSLLYGENQLPTSEGKTVEIESDQIFGNDNIPSYKLKEQDCIRELENFRIK